MSLNDLKCIYFLYKYCRNRPSSGSIANRLWVDARGSIPERGKRFFCMPQGPDRLLGPPNLLSSGYGGALSSGVMRLGREADHSPPSSAEVELYLHSQIRLHGVVFN
jgi:hypothetical protein